MARGRTSGAALLVLDHVVCHLLHERGKDEARAALHLVVSRGGGEECDHVADASGCSGCGLIDLAGAGLVTEPVDEWHEDVEGEPGLHLLVAVGVIETPGSVCGEPLSGLLEGFIQLRM